MVTRIGQRRRAHLYIEEWMKKCGLNDEKLATRIGVARETVWRWRKEQHRLNPDKIAILADALGIEPEGLWRPPGPPSIDAMLADADDELRQTAADIVQRLTKRA